MYRIIKRFIKRKLGIEKGKKESLKSLLDLLRWTDKFQTVNLKEIKSLLSKYNNKVVYINTIKDLKKLINIQTQII